MERFGLIGSWLVQNCMKKIGKNMIENQISKPWMQLICFVFLDLIDSLHKHERKPNAKDHESCAETPFTNLKFSLKTQILKTYLQVDSSLKTYSISLPGLPVNDSSQKLNPILKGLVKRVGPVQRKFLIRASQFMHFLWILTLDSCLSFDSNANPMI